MFARRPSAAALEAAGAASRATSRAEDAVAAAASAILKDHAEALAEGFKAQIVELAQPGLLRAVFPRKRAISPRA